MNRRSFFMKIVLAAAGLAAAAAAIPGIGFFFAPFVERKEQKWQRVGSMADFKPGTTTKVAFDDPSPLPWAGVVARTAAWLRCEADGKFVAFSVNCTHLGCPVRWIADAELFMCPCHGGVYDRNGKVAGGPPPRPLSQYEVRVREGQVEVLTAELPL